MVIWLDHWAEEGLSEGKSFTGTVKEKTVQEKLHFLGVREESQGSLKQHGSVLLPQQPS